MAASKPRSPILRTAPPAAFLMLDLDHFKRVNDTWGTPRATRLVHLANLLRGNLLRKEDMAGRLGGEGVCGAVA